MRKSTALFTGIGLLTVALCLFSTDNLTGAITGTACLIAGVLLIQWSDSMRPTQDEKRHDSNFNKNRK